MKNFWKTIGPFWQGFFSVVGPSILFAAALIFIFGVSEAFLRSAGG